MSSKTTSVLQQVQAEVHYTGASQQFPNSHLPVLIYKNALAIEPGDYASIEKIFSENNWLDFWADNLADVHHYHSTAHEVLAIYAGCAKVQFGGGIGGLIFELNCGDVVLIPAGVAHKNMGSTHDFACVGAYPKGQRYDMNFGDSLERPFTDRNIALVKVPQLDPLYGKEGDMHKFWS